MLKARAHEAASLKKLTEESKWMERELNVMEMKVTMAMKKKQVDLTV